MEIWWTITVVDCNQITWEHRICFDAGEFWGVENLTRLFPDTGAWTLFLAQLFTSKTGQINRLTNRDGETSQLSWEQD